MDMSLSKLRELVIEKPGVLQSMGSQRVGHDWSTELDWTDFRDCLIHLKRLWCWERLRAGGEGDDRGWDGWMALLTQQTWIWVNSKSWWWIGRPVMLKSMGLPFPSPMHENEVAQSCLTLRDPMDCSLPGSSAHGIFQARVLEWGAIAFSQRSTDNCLQLKKSNVRISA